jgi:lipopolysaccharide/colanic/teichoic acid biosynthesis glycosyltransferase
MKAQDLVSRAAAGLLLISVAPLLGICAAAIFLEDGMPIIFRQQRVGLYGRRFVILKLRTMKRVSGPRKITADNDSRITAAGRLMRHYKIDELPQLWNVFRGDMSFIGPRPEVPEYVDLSDRQWQTILSVRPGITDLASLAFRNEQILLSGQDDIERFYCAWLLPRKLCLSAHYIRTRSLSSDIKLLIMTIRHSLIPSQCEPVHIAQEFKYREEISYDA